MKLIPIDAEDVYVSINDRCQSQQTLKWPKSKVEKVSQNVQSEDEKRRNTKNACETVCSFYFI